MDTLTGRQDGQLIIALGRAMQHIHRGSEAMLHRQGLTMAQFTVLEALRHKGTLTVKEIIRAVLSTGGNMTVVVRNLESRGLVRRDCNPADRRSFLIAITDAGAELLDGVYQRHMELVAQATAPLTAAEKNEIITILKKISKG